MILTSDKDFEEALESPEALELHLAKLKKQRRLGLVVYGVGNLTFFFCFFVGLWGSSKASNVSGVIWGVAMVMLFLCITNLCSVLSAQADIRALLSYKRLRYPAAD